jgi:hypothetical protein
MFKLYLKRFFDRTYVRYLHLVMVAVLVFFLLEWQHENNLYENIIIANNHNFHPSSDTAEVRTLMLTISALMVNRSDLFHDHQNFSIKQRIFQSADRDLMYGSGACGGFSKVLARALQLKGYKVRIAQLKTLSYGYGGHTVVEFFSLSCQSWVMVDPILHGIFIQANGKWAGIKEVMNHWSVYEAQMPEKFRREYRYDGVRYTNWDKLGFLSRGVKAFLDGIMGKERADELCLRTYFLSPYPTYFTLTLSVYVLLLMIGWRLFYKKHTPREKTV